MSSIPDNLATDAPILLELAHKIPQDRISTKSCTGFEEQCLTYVKDETAPPLAVVRPQSESEVAATVAYTNEKSIPLAIRSGGHDNRGRSRPSGALVLDMREMKSVDIVDDGKAAIVGGGILAQDLADALAKTGHTTAYGASGTVGYIGWATHGGYGPFSGLFGLGIDQIIGARVADFQGNVKDASEELLYGIRGAGSAFGVIVSLKIKIYKLKKILAGGLIFSFGPVENDLGQFLHKYQAFLDKGIPKELGLEVGVSNIPNSGRALFCSFVWASPDIEAGNAMVNKMEQAIGPIAIKAVFETTPADWLRSQLKNTPQYGEIYAAAPPRSMLVPRLDEVGDTIVEFTERLPPNPATLWLEHHVHGAALEPTLNTCFPYRTPHFVIEAISTSTDPETAGLSGEWAIAFEETVRAHPQTYVGGYVVLSSSEVLAASCYPNHWAKLQALKSAFDPVNRFSYSVTGLQAP